MKRISMSFLLGGAAICAFTACGSSKNGSAPSAGGSGVGTASTQALTPSQKAACATSLSQFKDAQQTSESNLTLQTVSGKVCSQDGSVSDGIVSGPISWGDVKLNVVKGVPTATEGKFVEIFNADTCERFGAEVDQLNIPPVVSQLAPGVKNAIGRGLKSASNYVSSNIPKAKGVMDALTPDLKSSPVHAYMTDGSIQAKFAIGASDGVTVREGSNRFYFRYYKNCLPNGEYKNSLPDGKTCDNPGEVKSGSVVLNVKHEKITVEPTVDPCSASAM